ncbi:MAG: hypothetical protein V7K69_17000 [Nostoc sp.]|uniref:hypothetical protein n=1 Tax=Nostoc sp. TaxID=1180 RepID=UPI002FF848E5
MDVWGGEVGLATDQMSTNRTQNDSRLTQLSNGVGQSDSDRNPRDNPILIFTFV